MENSSFIQPVITWVVALIGAFVGSLLTRRTDHEKWLRQERTNAFGNFLRELHDVRQYASNTCYATNTDERGKSIKITEAFSRLQKHLGIARLFMSREGKSELSDSVHELWVQCTSQNGLANQGSQIENAMSRIQTVLERELDFKVTQM
jgi:hypothetical protein